MKFKSIILSFIPVLFLFMSFNVSAKRELTYIELAPTIKSGSVLNICVATLDQREVVLLEETPLPHDYSQARERSCIVWSV